MSFVSVKYRIRGAEKAIARLASGEATRTTRDDMRVLGEAGVADSRAAIDSGVSPEGETWEPTKDGRRPRWDRVPVSFEITGENSVRVGTDDVRAVFPHRANRGGSWFSLGRVALVPFTEEVRRRWEEARDYRTAFPDAFKFKAANGKLFLVERDGDRLNFLAIFKRRLFQQRRHFIGEGPQLQAAAEKLVATIAARLEAYGGEV